MPCDSEMQNRLCCDCHYLSCPLMSTQAYSYSLCTVLKGISSHKCFFFFSLVVVVKRYNSIMHTTVEHNVYMFVFKCARYHSFSSSLYQPFIYFHLLWGISFFLKATSRTSSRIWASEILYYIFCLQKEKEPFDGGLKAYR